MSPGLGPIEATRVAAIFGIGALIAKPIYGLVSDLLQVPRHYLVVVCYVAFAGAFIAASALSIAVVWPTDPFSVIALSSRAFALFYAVQAVLALWVSLRTGAGGPWSRTGFVIVGMTRLVAAIVGAPAEG